MIVAGLGCRRGVTAEDILAGLTAGMAEAGLSGKLPDMLATGTMKRDERAIGEAGARIERTVVLVDGPALAAVEPALVTRSAASRKASGSSSLAEAAALAAAGPGAKLLAPRTIFGAVTCAVAQAGGQP
ncbi:MAG: cobalamin biosynthesis protein [Nitratireductor sp.]